MKGKPSLLTLVLAAACVATGSLAAATPEQEKAFVEKYKSAFQSGDKAALEAFLYTVGANPQALQFYKVMQSKGLGGEITDIALLPLTPEDVARVEKGGTGPGGQKYKLPLKPTKKLKMAWVKRTADGATTSVTELMVAEKDGKLVIPAPVVAK
jgi:hypothetical protein